jgi:phospholipid transport system substrate-binding protein
MKTSRHGRISALALAVLLLAPVAGAALDAGSARLAVREVVDRALEVLRDGSLSQAQKRQKIQDIASERFDFRRISKLVLARNWKKLTPEQRDEFLVEFKQHLSLTYGRRLARFSNETVEVGDVVEHSNGDVTVKSKIVGGEADGVALNYRMRERDGTWYAIDLIVENISMIANFRSQIQEIVSSRGADGLIDGLREKNQKEAELEEKGA